MVGAANHMSPSVDAGSHTLDIGPLDADLLERASVLSGDCLRVADVYESLAGGSPPGSPEDGLHWISQLEACATLVGYGPSVSAICIAAALWRFEGGLCRARPETQSLPLDGT